MARPFTLSACLAALAASTAGCPPPPEPTCNETVLPNCDVGPDRYSDEACFALDDALARMPNLAPDATRGATIEAPSEGAVLPAAQPAVFRWTGRLARRLTPREAQELFARAPRPAPRVATFGDELRRFVTLLPPAYAHCAPFDGIGYALLFRANGRTVLRVERSTTEYTPDEIAWQTLRRASGPIELTILTTRFVSSRVPAGQVPFASAPRRFTIGN